MNAREARMESFGRLLDIMDELREQCPWDKKQTLTSLRYLTIEETYELSDAILEGDLEELKGEVGDLLLHMVFYSKIASEQEAFDIGDALNSICEKLIRRHPHIYGDVNAMDEETVKANWEKIKLEEGRDSVLEGVPKSLPAMVKANRIQEKARGVGFDWNNPDEVWGKVEEELTEFKAAAKGKDMEEVEAEFGDVLFSLINYARFVKVNPEDALERTNKKFIKRFQYIEEQAKQSSRTISDLSMNEMNTFWEAAKKNA